MAAPAREQEILAGGQAVLEGVMMKLPRAWAVTVRLPSGALACRVGDHVPWTDRWPVLRLPVLRGVATLGSMMVLGFRSLFFSSDVLAREMDGAGKAPGAGAGKAPGVMTLGSLLLLSAVADGPDGTEPDDAAREPRATVPAATEPPGGGGLTTGQLALSISMAAGMFLLLFKALPLGIAWLAARAWPTLGTPLAESVISGVALAAIFVGYLFGMSRIPDIRRVFQYHGAEHKVVHVHEKRRPLTVGNARLESTLHPRCGTSFLFFVVLTSIVVWSLFPLDSKGRWTGWSAHDARTVGADTTASSAPTASRVLGASTSEGFLRKLGLRLALFPLILGLSFELIRLSARHRDNVFFKVLMAPGLWSQRITTKPPDDGMLEVSLHSLALASAQAAGGAPRP